MAAFVEHSFERKFLLDEERLRKLREIITERLSKRSPELKPSYKVYRGDSYSYITESVDDVIKEDNDDWRKITKLETFVEGKDDLEFRLVFSSGGIELNIKGEERDEVFLLYSDLRDYLNNDVAVSRSMSGNSLRTLMFLFTLLTMIGFIGFTWYQAQSTHQAEYQSVLSSGDVQSKLDFIIKEAQRRAPGRGILIWVVIMFILMWLIFTGAIEKSSEFLFPGNIFLFGKRKQSFESRRKFLSNILWIVLVGLGVSIVAGIIVWYVTTTRN